MSTESLNAFMEQQRAVLQLGRGATLVIVLMENETDELVRWKPAPERWSMLEVVNHLADEEVFDFRTRVERTLRDPAESWVAINPQEWVESRNYNAREPKESLERFQAERQKSVEWLRALRDAPWSNVHAHPKLGPMSARMLLANWIAHDLLHVRQMMRLQYEWLAKKIAPEKLDYAGPWT